MILEGRHKNCVSKAGSLRCEKGQRLGYNVSNARFQCFEFTLL